MGMVLEKQLSHVLYKAIKPIRTTLPGMELTNYVLLQKISTPTPTDVHWKFHAGGGGGGRGLKSQIFEGKYEAELEFLEWGSSSQKTNLRGGGGIMDIFWNHTIHDNFHSKLWLSFFDDGHSLALRLGIQMWALLGGTHVPVCLPSEF